MNKELIKILEELICDLSNFIGVNNVKNYISRLEKLKHPKYKGS